MVTQALAAEPKGQPRTLLLLLVQLVEYLLVPRAELSILLIAAAGRDNTVKYRWRTLQLLPGMERPSYAGTVVEVLEGLDGQLAVRYQGEIIPSQEAPPRPGILRSFNGSSSHGSVPRLDLNGLGRRWEAILEALDVDHTVDNGPVAVRKAAATPSRKPTPLQTARWNAVQKAKRRGLSIRSVARELAIHRDTAKKYMQAESPPMKRPTVKTE